MDLERVEQDLHEAMSQEVKVMREVLGTMQQEQQALMFKDEISASTLANYRITLVSEMRRLREKMTLKLEELGPFTQQKDLLEDCEFMNLKGQILSLGEKIVSQNLQNRIMKGVTNPTHCQCYTPKPKLGVITIDP